MVVNKELKGIKGWLLLLMIIFIIGGLIWVFDVFLYAYILIKVSMTLSNLIIFLISAFHSFLIIYTLILGFNKRKNFVKWAIWSSWIVLVLSIVITILLKEYSSMSSGIVGTVIWTLYLIKSKRVKNTFVK